MSLIDIRSMTIEELELLMKDYSEPAFRAKQVFSWLQSGVSSFQEMTNISKQLREKLSADCYIANVSIAKKLISKIDGTVKYLFKTEKGQLIESVMIPEKERKMVEILVEFCLSNNA